MKKKYVANFYKKQQATIATPGELIILLYNGAIEFLNKAEGTFNDKSPKKIESFHNCLISCQNILTELIISLDMQEGGEVASNLFKLYDYMHYRLVEANMNKNIEIIKEVKGLLIKLKNAWENAESQVKKYCKNLDIQQNKGLNIHG